MPHYVSTSPSKRASPSQPISQEHHPLKSIAIGAHLLLERCHEGLLVRPRGCRRRCISRICSAPDNTQTHTHTDTHTHKHTHTGKNPPTRHEHVLSHHTRRTFHLTDVTYFTGECTREHRESNERGGAGEGRRGKGDRWLCDRLG